MGRKTSNYRIIEWEKKGKNVTRTLEHPPRIVLLSPSRLGETSRIRDGDAECISSRVSPGGAVSETARQAPWRRGVL